MAKKEKTLRVPTTIGEIVFFTDDLGGIKLQVTDKNKHGIVAVIPKNEIPAMLAFLKEFK